MAQRNLSLAGVVGAAGAVIMAAAIFYGVRNGDFLADNAAITNNPWGLVSLIDVYIGFALFACWVIWRERSLVPRVLWVALILSLGNLASCVYVLWAAYRAHGDARRFWMGEHYDN